MISTYSVGLFLAVFKTEISGSIEFTLIFGFDTISYIPALGSKIVPSNKKGVFCRMSAGSVQRNLHTRLA